MPHTLSFLALSCLATSFLSTSVQAAAIPQSGLEKRQGCNLEPNDVNCALPFWLDDMAYLTFDDLKPGHLLKSSYNSIYFTNFTVANPNTNASQYVDTKSGPNYLRLHGNTPGFIQPDGEAVDSNGNKMAFVKMLDFYYGCSLANSGSTRQGRPANCTVSLTAMCAAPGDSLLEIQEYAQDYKYTVPSTAATSQLMYADMKTNGSSWKCFNYTVSAVGDKNQAAVLYLDQIQMVEYYDSPLFG